MVNSSLCWNRNFLLPDAVIKMSEKNVDMEVLFILPFCGLPQPGSSAMTALVLVELERLHFL
jgi:hypothetical protein